MHLAPAPETDWTPAPAGFPAKAPLWEGLICSVSVSRRPLSRPRKTPEERPARPRTSMGFLACPGHSF